MKKINAYLVVGSGPAAMACCSGLIEEGIIPTVVDIGSTEICSLSNLDVDDEKKVPKRRLNNYMYSGFANQDDKSFMLESIGFGGFSTVWGGVIRKPTESQLDDWPISLDDLQPSFDAIDKFFFKKNVVESFEYDIKNTNSRECSKIIYSKINPLNIFSTDKVFEKWIDEKLVEYLPQKRVTHIYSENNYLCVLCSSGEIFNAETVFLASGAYQTALIVANSLSKTDFTIGVHENKLIITLWLTLSKKLRKLGIPNFCTSHYKEGYYFQFYEFKFSYLCKVFNFIRPLNFLAALIASFITFSFSYSSQEKGAQLKICRKNNKINIETINTNYNNNYFLRLKQISRFYLKKSIYLGSKINKFGFGYHIGASFPMKRFPQGYESDIKGSISEFPGLHIVDGAVLSTLPPIPLTYLIMANSLRITKSVFSSRK